MKKTFAGRSFQPWEYRVSHGQLLVRSPRQSGLTQNVDLIFAGVEYVDLPRHLLDLELSDATAEDVAHAAERLGRAVDGRKVTVLTCQGRRHLVVATAVVVRESEMDIFDSPFAD